MPEKPFALFPDALWRALTRPDVWLEVAVLAFCLLGAALLARRLRSHSDSMPAGDESRVRKLRRSGVRRLAFPLLGMLAVAIASFTLEAIEHSTELFGYAFALLAALAAVRVVVFALRHAFAPSGSLAAFERTVAGLVWAVFALHIVGLLPELIAALDRVSFSVGKQRLTLWLILHGVVIVLATLLLALWLGGLVEEKLMRSQGIDASLRIVLARVAKSLLAVIAVLIALPLVGIDLTALSVFGGALGVGLGFGLQKIASNYVSGFIILLDRSIELGDLAAVDKYSGVVTQITTRYTVLRALSGVEAIVPNEMLVSNIVSHQPFPDKNVRVAITVRISYRNDPEQAMQIMIDAAKRHPRVLADPAPKAFCVKFDDNGINLELGVWMSDAAEDVLGLQSDLNLEIWRRFKQAGIEIPYPQREVRMLQPAAPSEASSPAGAPHDPAEDG